MCKSFQLGQNSKQKILSFSGNLNESSIIKFDATVQESKGVVQEFGLEIDSISFDDISVREKQESQTK